VTEDGAHVRGLLAGETRPRRDNASPREAYVSRLVRSSAGGKEDGSGPFFLNYSFGAQLFDVRVIVAELVENFTCMLAK
jgi:hypothetical protein